MNNFLSFFLNSLLIFLLSKIYTKGYLDKYFSNEIPEIKNQTNLTKEKNETKINETYNYSSEIYIPKNETCETLGIHTWKVLHSIAASYSNHPDKIEKKNFENFFYGLIYFYPSNNNVFKEIVKKHPLENKNREELVYYICDIHNILNKKLGKKKFNCRHAFDIWGGDCGCDS